ncbi:short chain dehydrogenase [Apiospora kogelbergensis]|uniref:Short chain dehydrogenase n=1 Tax=Apiospora kogelbergensis TaxID=1337665 RepID=A0AAW0RCE6_9PEZI
MSSQPNVWFIAGASSGFGKQIALEALSRGDAVIASSRRTAGLTELSDRGAVLLDLDVTSDDATIRAAFARGESALLGSASKAHHITHFVNAAGYILEGPVEAASQQEVFDSFNVNVMGIMNMTKNEIAWIRKRGQQTGRGAAGRSVIANFGSLGSWRGGPAFAYYAAAKWAVSGFTESVAAEVKELGIDACVIEPGYFRTGFLNPGGGHRITMKNPLDKEYEGTQVEYLRGMLEQVNDQQPGDVVKGCRVIVDVLTRSGDAQGKEVPVRLPLGQDCVDVIEGKMASTQSLIEDWRAIITSTDHE